MEVILSVASFNPSDYKSSNISRADLYFESPNNASPFLNLAF